MVSRPDPAVFDLLCHRYGDGPATGSQIQDPEGRLFQRVPFGSHDFAGLLHKQLCFRPWDKDPRVDNKFDRPELLDACYILQGLSTKPSSNQVSKAGYFVFVEGFVEAEIETNTVNAKLVREKNLCVEAGILDLFLRKIIGKALKKANELDTDEPKLVWPKPEEVRRQNSKKGYPVQEEKHFVRRGKMKRSTPGSYPVEEEVIERQ